MTRLSVNVNKLATLRNARGKNNPDVVKAALDIVRFGAHGITVHPRPDERHIRRQDVYDLKKVLNVEFNIEGYPTDDFLDLVAEVRPEQVTLVPDPPDVITSNAGWKVRANEALLGQVTARMKRHGARVSVFIDPWMMIPDEYRMLKSLGVDRIELFTEAYAENPGSTKILQGYVEAATLARASGLGVNAGHDLSLENLSGLVRAIPWISEVSIGHAFVCDALDLGLELTVQRYLQAIQGGSQFAFK